MTSRLFRLTDKIIIFCFYFLFFLVPLILTPFNYELFEYNKMMLTYALTTIIVGSWIMKMVVSKKIEFARTPLDLPIIIFLFSQIISTVFSIDPHVSVFGYYSRFNGGLLSTVSYILLYYAFVNNFPKAKLSTLFSVIITSGLLVSVYGILEKLGIDKNLWVQDVQNRVFSTLGQPNWLAAYLAVLIPIVIGLLLNSNIKILNSKQNTNSNVQNLKQQNSFEFYYSDLFRISNLGFVILSILFYTALLFTKSRSGFLGFWAADIVLMFLIIILNKNIIKLFIILNSLFLILSFAFSTPFQQFNRLTLPKLLESKIKPNNTQNLKPETIPTSDSIIDVGITESGKIRNIVWKGALDIFLAYPLFGSGVETFAFSYYRHRPAEHNLTSEWDFLYNKAHNEYLNYAANTGILGLGSYLLIICSFIWWSVKNIKNQRSKNDFTLYNLHSALLSAWFSILITNFFGFSVVIVQIFFFLIPAISFLLSDEASFLHLFYPQQSKNYGLIRTGINNSQSTINNGQLVTTLIVLFIIFYLLYIVSRLWYADVIFAAGFRLSKSQDYLSAYQSIKKAAMININEPFYYDELSIPASVLAVSFFEEKQSTISSELKKEAIFANDYALSISPNNVNFWKTRTRMFYLLMQIDNKYLKDAVDSLEVARLLSPTDPKILYNLAVMYDKLGKNQESKQYMTQATLLKPDYRDAYMALALLYERDKEKEKAKEALEFIIRRINPNDQEASKKLKELN